MPVSVPGGKPAGRDLGARSPSGVADLADDRQRRRGVEVRAAGGPLGERGAVGGEDRRALRGAGAPRQLLALVEPREDQLGLPGDPAVGDRHLELAAEGAEGVVSTVTGALRRLASSSASPTSTRVDRWRSRAPRS